MKLEFITNSEEETIMRAKEFAMQLSLPTVLSLDGDLGAGKTTFTKGLGLGVGVQDMITSPTFTILNDYDGKLYHFDMYRLSSLVEAQELGFHEYFETKKPCLVVCEWASNVPGILPKNTLYVYIKKLSETQRHFFITSEEL